MQGSTQPLDRLLFPKKRIEERHTKKLINFNSTDVTRDQKLLELLPAKTNDFYPLSQFYNDFTNFQVNEKDFSKTFGFEDTSYRFLESEISDIFKVHIIHSNNAGTQYFFDFFSVFKLARERGVGETFKDIFYLYLFQNETERGVGETFKNIFYSYLLQNETKRGVGETFKDIFYSYLLQNETEVFTTEEKFSNRFKKNICYIVNNQGQFKFLGKDIEDAGPYWSLSLY